MWNIPSKQRLDKIPRLHETEHVPALDKIIHLNFFLGGCDWFVAEYDGDDVFFGFVVLNGDTDNAEWGYFSFSELKALRVGFMEVDCEHEDEWTIKPARDIPPIYPDMHR